MNKKNIFHFLLIVAIVSGCSSSTPSVDSDTQKSSEIYVFDDVEKTDSTFNDADSLNSLSNDSALVDDSKELTDEMQFIVQVGAYSVKEHAESFVKENQSKIKFPMSISFNDISNLYLIQLPGFSTREKAENVRNTLWKIEAFKDAFILSTEK